MTGTDEAAGPGGEASGGSGAVEEIGEVGAGVSRRPKAAKRSAKSFGLGCGSVSGSSTSAPSSLGSSSPTASSSGASPAAADSPVSAGGSLVKAGFVQATPAGSPGGGGVDASLSSISSGSSSSSFSSSSSASGSSSSSSGSLASTPGALSGATIGTIAAAPARAVAESSSRAPTVGPAISSLSRCTSIRRELQMTQTPRSLVATTLWSRTQ